MSIDDHAPDAGGAKIRVGCVLSDPETFARVREAVQLEGAEPLRVAKAQALEVTTRARIAALVYDMEPGDASAVEFVIRVHAARPDWPVWLYYRPRPAVIERVAEVAALPGIWSASQGSGDRHEAEIRAHVRRLVTAVPRVRLLHLLDSVLRPVPVEVRQFLEVSLAHRVHTGPAAFRIRNGAANLSTNLRHLEKVCKSATDAGPKRLSDDLLLVFLTFKTLVFRVPLRTGAEHAGISSKDLDRLCRRVLGPDAEAAALEPRAQFEYALAALTKACRLPAEAADEIVQQVLREQVS